MRHRFGMRARKGVALAAAMLMVAALAGPATAADYSTTLPAGTACAGFDLRIDINFAGGQVMRTFKDQDGNVVRMLTAGTGNQLTFFNDAKGTSLALRSNGAVTISRPGPGALSTVTSIGHQVIILFPTDVPAGPSTTLFVGKVVYTVDADSNFVLLSKAGTSTDICAALD